MTATATIPNSSSSNDDSDRKAVVVVGCASGLVAWFTLLSSTATNTSSCIDTGFGTDGGDALKIVLTSSDARTWRSFDGAQVRLVEPPRSTILKPPFVLFECRIPP